MENKHKKKNRFVHIVSSMLICVFCSLFLAGCLGTGGSPAPKPRPERTGPYERPTEEDAGKYYSMDDTILNNNNVFMGAIGVYDVDDQEECFYDKYQEKLLNFENLKDRQFNALAQYIFDGLQNIYGNASGICAISGYGSNKSIGYNDFPNKYPNSINGRYKIKAIKSSETDPDTGVETFTFEYSQSTSTILGAWKTTNFNVNDIKNALINLYVDSQPVNGTAISLTVESDTNYINYIDSASSLQNTPTNYASIDMLGFTKSYAIKVLYYIAYGLVGSTNINNSSDMLIEAPSTFFPKTATATNLTEVEGGINEYVDNYNNARNINYKTILPKLVKNAFSMTSADKNASSIVVANDYFDNYSNTSLFPKLKRENYIYYDDVNKVFDSKEEEVDPKDYTYHPVDRDSLYDDDEEFDEEDFGETIPGTARKLKELIFLPKIDRSKYKKESFSMAMFFFGMKAVDSGASFEVDIKYNAVFDNGTTIVAGVGSDIIYDIKTNGKLLNVQDSIAKKARIKVSDKYSYSSNVLDGSFYDGDEPQGVFKDATCRITGVTVDSMINSSFRLNQELLVASTNEKIVVGYLNVYNNFFQFTDYNASFIRTTNLDKNYFSVSFDYYDTAGNHIDPVNAYLMNFTLSD